MAAAATAIGAVGVQPGVASHNSGTCEYVELGSPGAADNEIRIRRQGGTTTLTRSGDRIVIEGITCTGGTPTVENIARIVILTQGRRDLRLDLADGPLAPGASETGPGAEIGILAFDHRIPARLHSDRRHWRGSERDDLRPPGQ